MEVQQVLHMNGGAGDTSYVNNSSLQRTAIDKARPIVINAILDFFNAASSEILSIADLGCSSGPNTLLVVSEIIDAIDMRCHDLGRPSPEFRVFLNDLPSNDFNTLFRSLPSFQEKLRKERGSGFRPCYFAGVPGSFYGRLFPERSLHFVHSAASLHWLSQVPPLLESENGITLNTRNIYIGKSSPPLVFKAYLEQFQRDFSLFLNSRSTEMMAGGRMVLALLGRRNHDPCSGECGVHWGLLAQSLNDMVSQVPPLLESENGITLNTRNIYIGKSSPPLVFKAYLEQFQRDFSLFLNSRSTEMMAGGRMVLALLGRRNHDPCSGECGVHWGLLAQSLNDMVSQVPPLLESENGITLNTRNIYIGKSSPPLVFKAYLEQFQRDFSLFLNSRSTEMMAGGRMVLALLGRRNHDPCSGECGVHWGLLAQSLNDMVSQGIVEEAKVTSYNMPYYTPSVQELKDAIEADGSFNLDRLEVHELNWDPTDDEDDQNFVFDEFKSAQNVAKSVRAISESMLVSHFGELIIEDLFRRFTCKVAEHLSKEKTKHLNLVISMTKK